MRFRMMKLAVYLAAVLFACSDDQGVTGPQDPAVIRVDVTPGARELQPGGTLQLQATPYGATGPVSRAVAWSSTSPAVAAVDSTGKVQALGVGTTTIRARAGQAVGEASITVTTWDLMFFALAGGTFAETLVLPPNSGGFPERLFPVGRFAMDASPSPDGTRIAYAVRDVEGYTDLWVANRDGSSPRALVVSEGNDEWPSWSPDGTRIAFQSDRAGASDIYVIDADGSDLRRLTFDPLPGVTSEAHPAWSPDGTRIAYAGTSAGYYTLYTVRPDGTDVRRVTTDLDAYLEPAWSPDGSHIVARVVTRQDNEWDLAVIRVADAARVRHFQLAGWQRSPSWRPDGEIITFSGRPAPGQPWQIWTIAADGTGVAQQTPDSFTGGHRPVWLRTDGRERTDVNGRT